MSDWFPENDENSDIWLDSTQNTAKGPEKGNAVPEKLVMIQRKIKEFQDILNKIKKGKNISKYKRDMKKLQKLSPEIASDLRTLMGGIVNLSGFESEKYRKDAQKLLTMYKQLVQELQGFETSKLKLVREEQAKLKKEYSKSKVNTGKSEPSEKTHLIQSEHQKEMLRLENEIAHNERLIEEQERDSREIETQVLEINEIMMNVRGIVLDQQEDIDMIEKNVETTAVRIETGNRNLEGSVKHDNRGRTLMCLLLLLILGIGFIIGLAAVILILIKVI